jgi:hypothetical protein
MSEPAPELHPDLTQEEIPQQTELKSLSPPSSFSEQFVFFLNIGLNKAYDIWKKEDWQHKFLIVQFVIFILLVSISSLVWLRAKPALIKFEKFRRETVERKNE